MNTQELHPVAYVWTNLKGQAAYGSIPHDLYESTPLYAAPQPQYEPCAWLSEDSIGERYLSFDKPLDDYQMQPLFTHRDPSIKEIAKKEATRVVDRNPAHPADAYRNGLKQGYSFGINHDFYAYVAALSKSDN